MIIMASVDDGCYWMSQGASCVGRRPSLSPNQPSRGLQLPQSPHFAFVTLVQPTLTLPPLPLYPQSPPLWQRLVGRTSLSCRTCDVSGARPFPSVRALAEHVSSQHRRRMCFVCLHSRQRFPMEWPTMTGAELKAHMRECHPRCVCVLVVKYVYVSVDMGCYVGSVFTIAPSFPPLIIPGLSSATVPFLPIQITLFTPYCPRCEFCDCHFYDADACYRHMGSEHFQCMLCMAGGDYRYFETAQEMAEHNRTDHYVCTEPPCW